MQNWKHFYVTTAERHWEKVTVDEATRMRLNGESKGMMKHMAAIKKAGGVSLKESDGSDTSISAMKYVAN